MTYDIEFGQNEHVWVFMDRKQHPWYCGSVVSNAVITGKNTLQGSYEVNIGGAWVDVNESNIFKSELSALRFAVSSLDGKLVDLHSALIDISKKYDE